MMNAFTQGYSAYLFGLPAGLNPFMVGTDANKEWYDGWYAASDYYNGAGDSYYDSDG